MAVLPQYRFERLEDRHFPAVSHIFKAAFGIKRSPAYLKAKYDTAWCGVRHVAHLAFKGDTPAGFYGAVPQRFRRGDATLLGAHTCDSFVVPEFQRQGLHRELALRTYDHMREVDIRFVYAYHSEATYRQCQKLGWADLAQLRGYYLPTGAWPGMKVRNRLFPGKWPAAFDNLERLVSMPNSQASEDTLTLDYCPEFFTYKSFTPNRVLQLGASKVWLKTGGTLLVGDMQAEDTETLKNDLETLRTLAGRVGYGRILFQVFPGSTIDLLLKEVAVGFDSWPISYKCLSDPIEMSVWRGNFGDLDTF